MEQERALPAPELLPRLDALGLEFLAGILEVEIARHPENLAALAELGHVYTRAGSYEKGLEVDLQLVRRLPQDPTTHYNLACSLALLGREGPALDALERAVELGYADLDQLLADTDLAALRACPRFDVIVRGLDSKRRPSLPEA